MNLNEKNRKIETKWNERKLNRKNDEVVQKGISVRHL